ncbi:MAG: hypothetical protein R2712_10260 [Vicinamibacterales bacterium]
MRALHFGFALPLLAMLAAPAAAQPSITVDDDDITISGCVLQEAAGTPDASRTLAWTRRDIMLAAAGMPVPAASSRVFYWIDDDDSLAAHVGRRVELKGELKDFETGEVEIDRDGDYTEIELDLDGEEEKIRVPNTWLSGSARGDDDREFDIVARRIDVKDVKVLGDCR